MTDALLVKYLVGEADQADEARIEAWLAGREDNRAYFNQFKILWQQSVTLAPTLSVDESAAWKKFSQQLQQRPAVIPIHRQMGWWQIAALLVLAITGIVTFAIVKEIKAREAIQVVADNIPVTRTLPDGSAVILNKHASLEYPARFMNKERRVTMKGEVFFKVTSNARQPFVVACPNVNVTVVGTAFNVKATATVTTVIVEEGRVRVTGKGESILLNPGEQVVVNNTNGAMQKAVNTDKLYRYYRNHIFVCNATPLWKLIETLNEAYDANIVIANKELANLPISTTFDNEPLDKILNVVSQTFNVRVEKKDSSILLK